MDIDTGLQLWKEWFEWSGDPWEADRDNWTSYCFFCGEEKPNHEPDCVFVKAKNILELVELRDNRAKMGKEYNILYSEKPIHAWFELSYAQYLTVPRLVMQSMPVEWQKKMVKLLQEMDNTFDWRPKNGRYWVQLRDSHGKYSEALLSDYRHGDIEYLRLPIQYCYKHSPDNRFVCTLYKNHAGMHEAHTNDKLCATWHENAE